MIFNLLIDFFIFIFGLCIGSFLNCVIYRLEQKKSLKGRSFCPYCKHTLSWSDLVPVFSLLFLRGKCRYCKKKISVQYPLVEIATGVLFVLILSFGDVGFPAGSPTSVGSLLNIAFLFYVASVLIIVFVYDLKHYLIPDKILFPAIGVAFIYRLFENLNISNWILISNLAPFLNYFWAAAIASGFFLAIFLISGGRWMGFGDVKLAILMGILLGFPNILVGLFLAFFFGAIIGVILMVLNKKGLKSEIPFGPFLIAGTFIAMFWSQAIIQWYLKLF